MRLALAGVLGAVLVVASPGADRRPHADAAAPMASVTAADVDDADLTDVVQEYCVGCHNDRRLTGNLSLEDFDVAAAPERAETAEKMVLKLRARMMPPPGARRPPPDTLLALVQGLESTLDAVAAEFPNPGGRTFQRLNRAEYEASILDLLALPVDAGDYLPLDTKSANFDNIADVQMLSPTLMDAYLNAASEIARLAVGDPHAVTREATYKVPRLASQLEHVEGAPFGTRGGVSVVHNFPADGSYIVEVSFQHNPEGIIFGRAAMGEQVEVSIDGERVALLDIDRFATESDPAGPGLYLATPPLSIRAGPHRVTAAFIPTTRGFVNDLIAPHGHSITDTHIGISYGITSVPHLRDMVVRGPTRVTGVSETPSRRKIFSCRPLEPSEERPCAREIVTRLATQAYRRALDDVDVEGLMRFYDEVAPQRGFEIGVRTALEAILASPHFLFRLEEWPGDVEPGEAYALRDEDLASRLSFFLWGTPPDDRLRRLAREGDLSDPDALRAEARRMLEDPRAEALALRFGAQWLRLQDLEKVQPDMVLYPDFSTQLADAMRRETELFLRHMVTEDRSVLDLLHADYSFVNELLADHYEIPGVVGPQFRKVEYHDDRRRGILGHGSILTQTSLANRTSPVLRGKWVMEVLLGTPPPPPAARGPGPRADEGDGGDAPAHHA